jgi:hypothetical protein
MFKEGDFIVVKQDYPPYEQFGLVKKPMGDLQFAEMADGSTAVFSNTGVRAGSDRPSIRLATPEEVAKLSGPNIFVATTITPFEQERLTVEKLPSSFPDPLHTIAKGLKQPTVEDLLKAALNMIDADKCSENDMACVCIEKALVWLSIAEK